MNKLMRAAMVATSGVLICAAQSAGPASDGAQITFVKGYDRGYDFAARSDQEYFLLDGTSCRDRNLVAVFRLIDRNEKTRPVPAGAAVTVAGVAKRKNPLGLRVCENNVTFTPLAGHHYRLKQVARVPKDCHMEVVDLADNAPPPDLAYSRAPQCGPR